MKLESQEKRQNIEMNTHSLVTEDLRHIWHPCTQMKDHETLPLVPIKRARGVYLFDFVLASMRGKRDLSSRKLNQRNHQQTIRAA